MSAISDSVATLTADVQAEEQRVDAFIGTLNSQIAALQAEVSTLQQNGADTTAAVTALNALDATVKAFHADTTGTTGTTDTGTGTQTAPAGP